jgi:hypothetical protein
MKNALLLRLLVSKYLLEFHNYLMEGNTIFVCCTDIIFKCSECNVAEKLNLQKLCFLMVINGFLRVVMFVIDGVKFTEVSECWVNVFCDLRACIKYPVYTRAQCDCDGSLKKFFKYHFLYMVMMWKMCSFLWLWSRLERTPCYGEVHQLI